MKLSSQIVTIAALRRNAVAFEIVLLRSVWLTHVHVELLTSLDQIPVAAVVIEVNSFPDGDLLYQALQKVVVWFRAEA